MRSNLPLNVTLGNDLKLNNAITQLLFIHNTGSIPIEIYMVSDINLSNFTTPLNNDITIMPQDVSRFFVEFHRNGSDYRYTQGKLRVLARPKTVASSGQVSAIPAVDLKVTVEQLSMPKESIIWWHWVLYIIAAAVLILLFIIIPK